MKRLYPGRVGRRARRRRRFPDERPGVRDRGAVRPAGDHHRLRQRHLRHHPHAPGARISRPRLGDGPAQSGFRRLCARVRRLRRAVEKTADFPAAFAAAQTSGKPAIIHLKIDPEAITPLTTLAKIREKSLAAQDAK